MATTKIPGQTAPRILADLYFHDPRSKSPYNPFKDPPPGFDDTDNSTDPYDSAPKCNHNYTIKRGQTSIDLPDESESSPRESYMRKISAICQKCLWHVDVVITYQPDADFCPKPDYPLHHFTIRRPEKLQPDGIESYFYRCTACLAELDICIRPKRLTADYHRLLLDPRNLQRRYQEALEKDSDRRMEVQAPIKVLEALSTYLRDSLELVPKMKDIPVHNKRFMTSFGDDCDVLLNWLGFKKRPPVPEDEADHELWQLPKPPPADPFNREGPRVLLEDVMEELHATMRNKSENEKVLVKHKPPTPEPFDEKMSILLGLVEYEKGMLRRKRTDFGNDYLYAGLGAAQDFSTDLLLYSFRRQTEYDPVKSPYYYDCLTAIAKKNQTDDMNMQLALLASEGFVSRAEVRDAYRYLGFNVSDIAKLTDQDVLGHFESYLESSHHSRESELRERLKIIGKARGSSLLTNAAENVVQTPEQALKWLDPTYNGTVPISDDHVIALAVNKQAERKDQTDLCRVAVKLIAEERQSDLLRSWLAGTNGSDEGEKVASACAYLGIDDRFKIDGDVLESVRMIRMEDAKDDPSKQIEIQQHYEVLRDYLAGQFESLPQPDYENPVGLSNMGNTCYLNCLLQYFYTIRPLREVILDFDEYKIDTSASNYRPKKVDAQIISKIHVMRTQQFIEELRSLYNGMAHAPGPVVDPTWRLATLTLETGPIPLASIRRSTIGGDAPVITSPTRLHSQPLFGDSKAHGQSSNPYMMKSANSSECTLIDSSPKTPDTDPDDIKMDDAEEMGDTEVVDSPITMMPDPMDPEAIPLLSEDQASPPPPRAPPVPPRPIGPLNKVDAEASNQDDASRAAAEAAAQQQDVDEAMGNVLFKLQCSIKGFEMNGVQTDAIKELFYGNFIWKYLNTEAEDNDEAFSAINVSLTEKPKDINAGLDGAFAIDEVMLNGNRTKRFRTITKLPPVFQIYLQRQDFDHDRQDTVINKHHIQLNEVIYLDRFMTLADPELQALRQKAWKLDARLAKLQAKRAALQATTTPGMDGPDLLDATYQFVSSHAEEISADAAILERLQADVTARRADLDALATTIAAVDDDKARLFAAHQSHAYRLAAVFVHRGQGGARGGHYWVYVCDFALGVWRRYEDREVREVVDRNEIFGPADPESQGAPYFCVYVQDERKESIVDAVYRVKPTSSADGDTQMDDVEAVAVDSSDGSGSGGSGGAVLETVPENRSVMEIEMNEN